jgi:hypothetical protein
MYFWTAKGFLGKCLLNNTVILMDYALFLYRSVPGIDLALYNSALSTTLVKERRMLGSHVSDK